MGSLDKPEQNFESERDAYRREYGPIEWLVQIKEFAADCVYKELDRRSLRYGNIVLLSESIGCVDEVEFDFIDDWIPLSIHFDLSSKDGDKLSVVSRLSSVEINVNRAKLYYSIAELSPPKRQTPSCF